MHDPPTGGREGGGYMWCAVPGSLQEVNLVAAAQAQERLRSAAMGPLPEHP